MKAQMTGKFEYTIVSVKQLILYLLLTILKPTTEKNANFE